MKIQNSLKAVALIAILMCVAYPAKKAGASAGDGLPAFSDFVHSMMDGQAKVIRGVYAPEVLAFPVIQQPQNDSSAVSENGSEVTQFGPAARNHVIGLLAHNTLAGAYFSGLGIGQEIRIIYGNGRVDHFIVDHIYRFQVFQPNTPQMGYLDLSTNILYSSQDLFDWFYGSHAHLTLQTCIQLKGDVSWGRLFITAIPVASDFFDGVKGLGLPELQADAAIIHAYDLLNGGALLR